MEQITKYIVFKLKNQSYGVNVSQVLTIERLMEVTPVPGTAEFIKGIINLRGDTIPIVDLRERMFHEPIVATDDTRILIVYAREVQIGLIVDSATEVIDIDTNSLEPAPGFIGGIHEKFLHGIAKLEERLLIILDLERVLDWDEINDAEEAVQLANGESMAEADEANDVVEENVDESSMEQDEKESPMEEQLAVHDVDNLEEVDINQAEDRETSASNQADEHTDQKA